MENDYRHQIYVKPQLITPPTQPSPILMQRKLPVPANSTVILTTTVLKRWLHFEDFGLAPFRGVWVPPARLEWMAINEGENYQAISTALLIPLAVPDMSMPYNVLLIVGTVWVLGWWGMMFS